jgi:hypothetical protein
MKTTTMFAAATHSQRFLPASFQPVSSRCLTLASSYARLQGRAHFLLQVGDGSQGHAGVKDRFGYFLDAAFADAARNRRNTTARLSGWGPTLWARISSGMTACVTLPQQGQVREFPDIR